MAPAHRGVGRPQPIELACLLLMSLIFAGSALRSELLPATYSATLPPLAGLALALGLFACASALVAAFQGQQWPRGKRLRSSIAIALGLFALPALLTHFASPAMDGAARSALSTLTLVFTLAFEPYLSPGATGRPGAAMPAALAAVLGAMCVFPVSLSPSMGTGGAVAAMVLGAICAAAANCVAAALAREFAPGSLASLAALAAGPAALILAAASLLFETPNLDRASIGPELLWAVAVELPGLLLLFWLMPRLSATRLATRFLLSPLLAVSFGALLLQVPLQPRTWMGLLAMAGGAAYLLAAGDSSDEPNSLFPPRQSP